MLFVTQPHSCPRMARLEGCLSAWGSGAKPCLLCNPQVTVSGRPLGMTFHTQGSYSVTFRRGYLTVVCLLGEAQSCQGTGVF